MDCPYLDIAWHTQADRPKHEQALAVSATTDGLLAANAASDGMKEREMLGWLWRDPFGRAGSTHARPEGPGHARAREKPS